MINSGIVNQSGHWNCGAVFKNISSDSCNAVRAKGMLYAVVSGRPRISSISSGRWLLQDVTPRILPSSTL